jgi:hypothetical protein
MNIIIYYVVRNDIILDLMREFKTDYLSFIIVVQKYVWNY